MLIIKHRVNSIVDAKQLDSHGSNEVDLRTYDGNIVCAHDPIAPGELFENLIKYIDPELFIVCNIKEEAIECWLLIY